MIRLDLAASRRGRRLNLLPSAAASAGVRKLASQPSANLPARRSPSGALPPSQMSSGLAGRGPMLASSTLKNWPENVTLSCDSSSLSSSSDSSKTAARLPWTGKAAASGPPRRAQPEDRQHPPGREGRERGQLLGHEHRMPAGQHRDSGADLEAAGLRQRVGHADQRLDQSP